MIRILLTLLLLMVPWTARADWHEASSDHFVVFSEQSPEKLRAFAERLERFDRALRVFWNQPDPPIGKANRVTVFVVDDMADVQALSSVRNVAGFYQPRAHGSIAVVPRAAGQQEAQIGAVAILQHEYAHHFMLTRWANSAFPSWFIEGFAEFHATTRFDRDGSVVMGDPPLYRVPGLLDSRALGLERMLGAETAKLNAQQVQALYGRGWLLVHYLGLSGERKGQDGAYLRAINEGRPAAEAAKTAFGDIRALDREINRYARGRLSARRIPAESVPAPQVALRRLTPGEAASMKVRIRSQVGVTAETAPKVYAAAIKATAGHDKDAVAQRTLAEAAYDAGDYAAAEAAADRALAADPKLVEAHVYKAMAKMALAAKAEDRTPETWKAIRRVIATANRIDPDDPHPLILYFRSFTEAGEVPPELARAGLYRAFELAPQDPMLRWNAAHALVQEDKPEQARRMLQPLAYNPHGGSLTEAAAKLVADIDAGKSAAEIAAASRAESD